MEIFEGNSCLIFVPFETKKKKSKIKFQFAPFALSTQVGAIFISYVLDFIPAKTLRSISFGMLVGFFLGFVLQFGNKMLLTSLFLSSLITVQALILLQPIFYAFKLRILICVRKK